MKVRDRQLFARKTRRVRIHFFFIDDNNISKHRHTQTKPTAIEILTMELDSGTPPTLDGTPKRAVVDEARQSNSANTATGPSDTSNSGEVSHNDGAVNTSVPAVTPMAKRTQTVDQTILPGRVEAETTAYTLPTVQGDQESEGIQTDTRKVKVAPITTLLFTTTDSNGQTNMGDTNCAIPSKKIIMGIIRYLCNKNDPMDVRAIENSMIAMYISEKAENKDIEKKVRDENICPHFAR